MSKILHFFNILFLYCGCFVFFLFFMPAFTVKADTFTVYDNPGTVNLTYVPSQGGYQSGSFFSTPYGCYQLIETPTFFDRTCVDVVGLGFNVDSPVTYDTSGGSYVYTGNYNITVDGVAHTVYWVRFGGNFTRFPGDQMPYAEDYTGTRIFPSYSLNNDDGTKAVCNYFLFGIGELEYDKPAQDIEDADLDIVGLSCYILNNQTGSVDYQQTLINSFFAFLNTSIKSMFGSDLEFFLPENSQGIIENYVPGIALSWDSPPLDPDINYNIWVDGISNINYKTSPDPLSNFLNTQNISSCAYAKLKINDSSLSKSNDVYYYNTNQGLETILTYIEDHSSLSAPSGGFNRYSYVSLETKISRVYIQASKVVDGDTHYGALSYIDIIDGVPVVYEGVTSSVDDVPASDPSGGTPAVVGTPFTVSGDSITYGDTYYDNSVTNNITGLVVGGDILSVARSLFGAIWSLIKSLFLSLLVPWILLGFTGSTKGSFLL